MTTRTLKNASVNTILAVLLVVAIVGLVSAFVRPATAAEATPADALAVENAAGWGTAA